MSSPQPPRNVQIPWELFCALLRYVEIGEGDQEQLAAALEGKMQRILNRDAYSRAHNPNLPPEAREAARREYLEARGIPDDYRV